MTTAAHGQPAADFFITPGLLEGTVTPPPQQVSDPPGHSGSAAGGGRCSHRPGELTPGEYRLPGGVSSQFVTGLLFALPLLEGNSEIVLTSPLEIRGYPDFWDDYRRLGGKPDVL